jgi:hypothetical protein
VSRPKPQVPDLLSSLTPQYALQGLFDSDSWPEGLPQADPGLAAQIVVQWLQDSGFALVTAEYLAAYGAEGDRGGHTRSGLAEGWSRAPCRR